MYFEFCVRIVRQIPGIVRFGETANLAHGRSAIFCPTNLNIRSLMPYECASCVPLLRAMEEIFMAHKVGQIIARGDRRWLIRVYLGLSAAITKPVGAADSRVACP
jgi:hypothetical protein